MSYQTRNAERAKGHFADTPQWQIDRDTERGQVFWDRVKPSKDHHKPFHTVDVLFTYCDINNRQLQDANEYGDPGHDKPARGILLADWNNISQKLRDRVEKQGYALEWEDEWYIDSRSSPSKAYRTQPNYHGWESRVMITDGDVLTPDDDLSDWIEHCQDNDRQALPSWWPQADIAKLGWVRTSDQFEAGFHPGQNDNPQDIGERIKAAGDSFLFQVTEKGQFDVNFAVYLKRSVATFEQLSLSLRPDDAEKGSPDADPAEAIAELRKLPYIAAQLAALDPEKVQWELYDAAVTDWTEAHRSEDTNLSAILWLACCKICGCIVITDDEES